MVVGSGAAAKAYVLSNYGTGTSQHLIAFDLYMTLVSLTDYFLTPRINFRARLIPHICYFLVQFAGNSNGSTLLLVETHQIAM